MVETLMMVWLFFNVCIIAGLVVAFLYAMRNVRR